MSGETDLDKLLGSMNAVLQDGIFVFATLNDQAIIQKANAVMVFTEPEGTTLILHKEEAGRLNIAHEFPCRMITLNVHSALEAVGFIARIATMLAELGMGVNPVSGFYHDHLFVPQDRAEDAMAALKQMAIDASQKTL